MRAIFAIGQIGGRADADPDRLRLVRRQRHTAGRIADHAERRLFPDIGGLGRDIFEVARREHPLQDHRNTIGRGFLPDIVEEDFGAARSVKDDTCWRDEQVARCHCRNGKSRERQRGEAQRICIHLVGPQNSQSGYSVTMTPLS